MARDSWWTLATLAICLAACGDSTDTGTDDSTDATDTGIDDGTGDSGTGNSGTTDSGTGNSSDSTDTGTGSDDSADASTSDGTSTGGTTGSAGECPDNPNYTCAEPWDCSAPNAGCGDVDSVWDEDGCMGPVCMTEDDCDGTDKCYAAIDFGGCQSSGISCDDGPMGCNCVSLPDCGGAYCVPEDIYPG